jgi:hypothetical protein
VFPFVPPEGIQIRDLAIRAGVRKQTMAQSVDQLEQAGYLERRPNPRDGRSRLIVLTERGKAVLPLAAGEGDVIDTLIRTLPIMCRAVRTGRRLVEVSSSTTFWFACPTHMGQRSSPLGIGTTPARGRQVHRFTQATDTASCLSCAAGVRCGLGPRRPAATRTRPPMAYAIRTAASGVAPLPRK